MEKFKIIEEGRLSKSEMAEMKGGSVTCGLKPWGGTYSIQHCYVYQVTCTLNYKSCSDTIPGAYTTCLVITYNGQPGGGGSYERVDDTINSGLELGDPREISEGGDFDSNFYR